MSLFKKKKQKQEVTENNNTIRVNFFNQDGLPLDLKVRDEYIKSINDKMEALLKRHDKTEEGMKLVQKKLKRHTASIIKKQKIKFKYSEDIEIPAELLAYLDVYKSIGLIISQDEEGNLEIGAVN